MTLTESRAVRNELTVAIVNTSPDTVELLRDAFFHAGMMVVSCYAHEIRDGKLDFDGFIRQHEPRVIVYDIAPPYERNLRLFEHVRHMPAVVDRQFVLTSTNPARVTGMIGRDERIYEVVDRDEDLMQLVQAVKAATRARPTR